MKIDAEQAALVWMIRPTYARDYVKAKGWRRVQTKSREYALFETSENTLMQVLIPQDPRASDYAERILEAAERLSEIEERDLTAVLRDMLRPGADCLHFRQTSDRTASGVVSLKDGLGLLGGIQRVLEAAACTVVDPHAFFKRLHRAEAKQFLDACLLEQTGFGSYEMNVSCPLNALETNARTQLPLLPEEAEVPFVRKVTGYVMRAAAEIAESIEADATNELVQRTHEGASVQNSAQASLINANFCDALLDIYAAEEDLELSLSASWAPQLPPRHDIPPTIRFRPEYAEKIETISRQLKPRRSEDEVVNVIASVEALRGDISNNGCREGQVDLLVFDRESDELVPASAELNAQNYVTADRAHMEGGYVKVRGTFVRGRRKHAIRDIESFTIEE